LHASSQIPHSNSLNLYSSSHFTENKSSWENCLPCVHNNFYYAKDALKSKATTGLISELATISIYYSN